MDHNALGLKRNMKENVTANLYMSQLYIAWQWSYVFIYFKAYENLYCKIY